MSFKRKISYRYEITTQPKNNSLDCLINQICEKIINILFLLSFKNGNKDPISDPFNKDYMPFVEIKEFNALIENKPFLINQ